MSVSVIIELGNKVRVAGRGNNFYEVVEKVSPIEVGDWIVRKSDGSMLSVNPSILKVVK